MTEILVVDDDRAIREVVRYALEGSGFRVSEASDAASALREFRKPGGVDLVVLDVGLPGRDGLDVCREIRTGSRVPILFLSARDEEVDRVVGLEIGGDDYVTKPFSPRELVARVRALLRRGSAAEAAAVPPADPAELRHGDLRIDVARHRASWKDQPLELTVAEFGLLRVLLGRPGRVYSRSELVDRAFGEGHFIEDRTVDSHVKRLRKKLAAVGADPIETVYGVGYRLRE